MSKNHSGTDKGVISDILKNKDSHIHFTGFCGAGMYPLYKLSRNFGYKVSGSDSGRGRFFKMSVEDGDDVFALHEPCNVRGADILVYSLAVSEDNPEIIYACEADIPAVSRAEYFGVLMGRYKRRIGVAGTHGKSTTTAMLDKIFKYAGKDHTTVIGAALPEIGLPYRIGGDGALIYEACEYKDSFLHFSPTSQLFLNLEYDHVDYFSGIDALKESFLAAMNTAELSIVNINDANLMSIADKVRGRVKTFGISECADHRVEIIGEKKGIYKLKFTYHGKSPVIIYLGVAGMHNVMNAAAAFAAAREEGVAESYICDALSDFRGIERRLQYICSYKGASVYYDYAHHPTEIETVLRTVRQMHKGRVTVIFKPHTYSRTSVLMSEFAEALSLADRVILTEISAIRESPVMGVTSEVLASFIGSAAEVSDESDILRRLDLLENSVIIIMGAADLDGVKEMIKENG